MGDEKERYNKTPILSRTNHETWFRQVKFKLQAKEVFYTVENTKAEVAWVKRSTDSQPIATPESTSSKETTRDDISKLTSRFEKMGGSWHTEKAAKFDRDQAKVFAFLTDCLDDDDQAALDEFEEAKEVWTHLKVKYSKTSESTAQMYMTKIQTFQFEEAKGIVSAWETLRGYRRKLGAADPSLKNTYPDKTLFHILTRGLPTFYTAVIDGFRTQQSLSVEDKLRTLQEKEEDQEDSEQAHAAYRHPNHQSRRRKNSEISMAESLGKFECFYCSGEHLARDCEFKDEIREFGRNLRLDKESKIRKLSSRRNPSSRHNASTKSWTKTKSHDKTSSSRQTSKSKRQKPTSKRHGYAAQGSPSDSDSESPTESSEEDTDDDNDPQMETVHLAKALISKSQPTQWILDTGCTTPMTDQLNLFRGPLKNVKRTTIQVGGGKMYSSHRGAAEVKCKDGSSAVIRNTLYVPNLGVSLLSAKRLCLDGMKGSFDQSNI